MATDNTGYFDVHIDDIIEDLDQALYKSSKGSLKAVS